MESHWRQNMEVSSRCCLNFDTQGSFIFLKLVDANHAIQTNKVDVGPGLLVVNGDSFLIS
jgi:hypothetical protein